MFVPLHTNMLPNPLFTYRLPCTASPLYSDLCLGLIIALIAVGELWGLHATGKVKKIQFVHFPKEQLSYEDTTSFLLVFTSHF